MNPIASLVVDIENSLGGDEGERRQVLLQRITGLFIDQAPDLNEEHISVFDEVILCLALEIEFAARIELSERLADLPRGPRRTIQNLAQDPEIAVARPVIERSPCISNEDLAEIAQKRPSEFLAALSNRLDLPATVTDILLTRGDEEIIQRIAQNNRQTLSPFGLRLLAERATNDMQLYRILRGRPDLALRHVGAILEAAKQRARAEMRDLTERPDVLERALEVGAAALFINPSLLDGSEAKQSTLSPKIVWPTWPTDHKRIANQIERGNLAEALTGIAYLADIPRDTVERAFASEQFDSILFIARAIDMEWVVFTALLVAKEGRGLPKPIYDRAHTSFHALSISTARRVMHFMAAQKSAERGSA
jgi:uncharacterized protein (DUF2336 family)